MISSWSIVPVRTILNGDFSNMDSRDENKRRWLRQVPIRPGDRPPRVTGQFKSINKRSRRRSRRRRRRRRRSHCRLRTLMSEASVLRSFLRATKRSIWAVWTDLQIKPDHYELLLGSHLCIHRMAQRQLHDKKEYIYHLDLRRCIVASCVISSCLNLVITCSWADIEPRLEQLSQC